jgi:predicted DNA-binding protein with PD1-like motif
MKSKENKNIVIIQLFKDEEINEEIKNTCKKYNIESAIIITGIGQVKTATLGYFKEKGDYSPKKFTKPLEILSLSGNIAKIEKDYLLHIHVVLGDDNKNAVGGHLINGKISVTGEIILFKTNIKIKRKLDEKTGLMLFDLR